jgi:hypothetical protein
MIGLLHPVRVVSVRDVESRGRHSARRASPMPSGPPARAAVLVEPSGYLSMPVAETLRRNADPNADREAAFSDRNHLSWVAWHF